MIQITAWAYAQNGTPLRDFQAMSIFYKTANSTYFLVLTRYLRA